jgi:tungstate transport system substrate-binding protein
MKLKRVLAVLLTVVILGSFWGCTKEESLPILLSTTTSTENSGLLSFILPEFTKDTGFEVKVVAVGTGQALKMGENGEADVLLVHAKSSEEAFVADGHGLERFDVMYNDFVLIGPKNDPLQMEAHSSSSILSAFEALHKQNAIFVSRGDDSGTHKMELSLWSMLSVEPKGDWYVSAGQGMGPVIQMTNEKQGYTLTDRATYLSMKDSIELEVVLEGDVQLFNQYGVIAVNPNKHDRINAKGADAFVKWILSERGQALIGEFGREEFGESLFVPNAK